MATNYNKQAEEEPKAKIEKVTTGKVTVKEKSGGKKFIESFVEEDAHTIGSFLKDEVFIPTIKDLISNIVTNSIEMLLYGDNANPRQRGGNHRYSGGRTSYDKYYDRNPRNGREPVRGNPRNRQDIQDIFFDYKEDASEVLERLLDAIDEYDQVTIADYYSACDISPQFTDWKYGWTNLATARVERDNRYGYYIRLPKPFPLDD